MLYLKRNITLTISIIIGFINPLICQEYYKVIPTSAYPFSSLRNSVVIGQRMMNNGTHVAFEAYHGRPGRTNSYYGFYSADGDLVRWHELPDSNNIPFKKVFFFDSAYINSYYTAQDTFQVYSVNYGGSINWATKTFGLFDSYSFNRVNADSLFVLDTNGYYSLLELSHGVKTAKWRADSLFLKIEADLSLDSIISLNRVGVTDSFEFYEISCTDSGRFEKYLVTYPFNCRCWNLVTSLNEKQLIIQEKSPFIFSQEPIQLLGDSMVSDLMILDSSLDTLWNKTITEPAFLKKDSTFSLVPKNISQNGQGYFLLEAAQSRRSNESFIQNQYQIGVNFLVLDSTFQQVINLTIWPKDTIGRVIDLLYSSNAYLESYSKFYLDSRKALTVILSRDQQGLGDPLLMIHRTGENGISFLNLGKEPINHEFIELFPNPTNGITILKTDFDLAKPTILRIYDAKGIQVNEQKLLEKETELSFEGFKPGLYMVSVSSGGFNKKQKLLVY